MIKSGSRPGGRGKTGKPRLRRDGNAPLLPPAAASPPEGEILRKRREEFPHRGKGGALAPKGVHFRRATGPVALRCCSTCKLTPLPSTHSPTAKRGEGGGASHQRGGGISVMVRSTYASFLHVPTPSTTIVVPLHPGGKRLTWFSGRFAPLHPLLSLTHWIFGSLCSPTNPVR